jgi:tetratricopeptide (TPR) repeat protein
MICVLTAGRVAARPHRDCLSAAAAPCCADPSGHGQLAATEFKEALSAAPTLRSGAMAGLDAQRAVKMGAEELQNYMQELFSWSKDMKLKNAEKKPSKGAQAPQPPVRGLAAEPAVAPPAPPPAVNAAAAGGQQQAGQPGGSARHPAGHTYEHYKEKWDKFDLDAALAADEEEEAAATAAGGGAGGGSGGSSQQRLRGSSRGSSSGGTSSSQPVEIPRARVTVPVGPSPPAAPPAAAPTAAAAPTTAEGWKDAGNAHFKRGDHQRAVDAYTASLALQPSCLAYANRAMAQLKLGRHAAAEADCSEALRLDPLYVKGYQRRCGWGCCCHRCCLCSCCHCYDWHQRCLRSVWCCVFTLPSIPSLPPPAAGLLRGGSRATCWAQLRIASLLCDWSQTTGRQERTEQPACSSCCSSRACRGLHAASSCRWWCGQQQKRQQEGRRRGRLREGRMLTSRYPVYSGRSRRLWQERQRRLSSGARQMHRSSLLQWRLLLLLLLRPWRAFRCSAVQRGRTACPSCQSSHSCRRRMCSSRPRWCQPQQPSLPSPQRRQPARQQPPQQQPLLRRKCPAQVRFIIPGLQCLNMHSPFTVQIPCWSA